jgi:hypothetical protein
MSNTNTHTELGAVQAVQTYLAQKNLILANDCTSKTYKTIIGLLDDVDVVRALFILDGAKNLFKMKFEEIKKENS